MNNSQTLDIHGFIQEMINLLRANLASYPAFDQTKPYEEKNAYIIEVVTRGEEIFLSPRYFVFAEIFFDALKGEILEFERTHPKRFNKGMVYADLGIAQIAAGKLDDGVAHLLAADVEDQPFIHDPHGILNSVLWTQFEKTHIIDYLIDLNSNPGAKLSFPITENLLNSFFSRLDLQDRLFLEATIWTLRENLSRNSLIPNTYTRGRLYSGLKDLCLLTESLLRKSQIQRVMIQPNQEIMLWNLLSRALASQNINYSQQSLITSANNLQELVNNLENIINHATGPEIRRICCLHLIRNFTGHHFDLSETVISPSGRSFFDMYSPSLVHVLSSILYLDHINEI
jgi:hypothetical protein